jgi:hypothetical protein
MTGFEADWVCPCRTACDLASPHLIWHAAAGNSGNKLTSHSFGRSPGCWPVAEMAERPNVLRVGDRVIFSGTTHTVVAICGATIRLLSAAGATTVVAFPYLLGAEDFELLGAPAPKIDPHGLLDALPEPVLAAARTWERHACSGGPCEKWPLSRQQACRGPDQE